MPNFPTSYPMYGSGNNTMSNYNSYNQMGTSPGGPTQLYTILAPSDAALLSVKDDIINNSTLIDTV
jgi:hypothetical protein